MNKRIIATLGLFCLICSSVFAQETVTVRDLETWSSIGLRYKFNKKWSIAVQEQLRLKDNSSTIDQYFTQGTIKYKPIKPIWFGLSARYIRNNDNQGKIQGYENHMRFHADFGYKHNISRFKLKYRVRYQHKNELGISAADGDEARTFARFKVDGKYNIKKWKLDPGLAAEIFYNTSNSVVTDQLQRIRFTLYTNYDEWDFGDFRMFYRLERDLNTTYPKTTHIVGLNYQLTLKKKK